MLARLCLVTGIFVSLSSPTTAQIQKMVDPSATNGLNNGNGWADAYLDLQDAIDTEGAGQQEVHLLVAEATYHPSIGPTSDPRDKAFVLRNLIHLHGGFLGLKAGGSASTDYNAPDGSFARTILSGDIGVVDDSTDNSYHVVHVDTSSPSFFEPLFFETIVDGFLIAGGRADSTFTDTPGLKRRRGGGVCLLASNSLPAITRFENVRITENSARDEGGGVYVEHRDNRFGMRFSSVYENVATRGGGFATKLSNNINLSNVRFRDNGNDLVDVQTNWPPYTEKGGGIWFGVEVTGTASNVLMHDNFAAKGGGIFLTGDSQESSPIDYYLRHCTITQNATPYTPFGPVVGSALHVSPGRPGGATGNGNRLHIWNSILEGNGTGVDLFYDADPQGNPSFDGHRLYVNHTLVGDHVDNGLHYAPDGQTVVFYGKDPRFKNPAGRNFHLQDQAGAGNFSECTDAGLASEAGPDLLDIDDDPSTTVLPLDYDLLRRETDIPGVGNTGEEVDMGVYEVQALIGS